MRVREILAYIGAGIAAALTRFALVFMFHIDSAAYADPPGVRIPPMLVFFAVLVLIDRRALQGINTPRPAVALNADDFAPKKTPQETAATMARVFGGVTDDQSRRGAIKENLSGIPSITVLIPFIFYLQFGIIGSLGWGLTVFFDAYCLLWALGLFFLPRTEYHSPVRVRGDWLDRIGAFWLVGCVFGPFVGWVVFQLWPMTPTSWHWGYGLRAFLAAGLPVLLALPLLRYARGKSSLVALPLLLVITLLPVSTAIGSIRDLFEGPIVRQAESVVMKPGDRHFTRTTRSELYLKHTERTIEGAQ